jgi:hypothetical protein
LTFSLRPNASSARSGNSVSPLNPDASIAIVPSLVSIQQVRAIETLRASIAFMRPSILVTFQVTVEMVGTFIGSSAEMAAMRAV